MEPNRLLVERKWSLSDRLQGSMSDFGNRNWSQGNFSDLGELDEHILSQIAKFVLWTSAFNKFIKLSNKLRKKLCSF